MPTIEHSVQERFVVIWKVKQNIETKPVLQIFICLEDVLKAHAFNVLLSLRHCRQQREKDIEGMSFQNILKANENLQNWFSFDILFHFPDDDKAFLNRMFNRRHVLTHNGG